MFHLKSLDSYQETKKNKKETGKLYIVILLLKSLE